MRNIVMCTFLKENSRIMAFQGVQKQCPLI